MKKLSIYDLDKYAGKHQFLTVSNTPNDGKFAFVYNEGRLVEPEQSKLMAGNPKTPVGEIRIYGTGQIG